MAATDDALRSLWERHRGAVLEQVAVIERAVTSLIDGGLEEQARADAQREAHKLAGSVGTFGFDRASERARELELSFADRAALGSDSVPVLAEKVLALRAELDDEPQAAAGHAGAPAGGGPPLVLIVDDDETLVDRLAAQALRRGLRAATATSPDAAAAAVEAERPDLVLLDLTFPDGVDGAYTLLSRLTGDSVPVLALTTSDELTDRVEVARRGGRGFLRKSMLPEHVIDEVVDFLDRERAPAPRVLALDDDQVVLDAVGALLEPLGVEMTALSDPSRFWDVLHEAAPDLVILDYDMPFLSGVEVCRVLRNDPRWTRVPVLFLTGRTDRESIARIFEAGADDYVTKPVVGDELTVRVTNRLSRTRLYRTYSETDSLTGIANRRGANDGLQQLLQLADRFGQPLSVALLDLDRFKSVNDDFGHAAGDAVLVRLARLLQRAFRGEDVVARWGGEEFLVAMYGASRRDAVRRLTQALERFRTEEFTGAHDPFRATFSAGVAEYGVDGTGLASLLGAADDALYAAKLSGRAAVVPAGGAAAARAEPVDVAVVEDDDLLGELLLQTLEGQGHEAVRLTDGERAAVTLGGASPELPARVILLDVDLPGLDGLSVLRRLRAEGTLRRSKVIMLTARSAEAEVMQALELGACDHLAKPCSMPVLLHKVRQALER
jgi:diguanylate cyclase (GGDEF)-like protein